MSDWDEPSPWYVYTFFGLAFAFLACLSNDQWWWSVVLGLALMANAIACLWVLAAAASRDGER